MHISRPKLTTPHPPCRCFPFSFPPTRPMPSISHLFFSPLVPLKKGVFFFGYLHPRGPIIFQPSLCLISFLSPFDDVVCFSAGIFFDFFKGWLCPNPVPPTKEKVLPLPFLFQMLRPSLCPPLRNFLFLVPV